VKIKLGIVMDDISLINIKKDTSFAMLLEAQARSWSLFYMEIKDLFLKNGQAFARTRTLEVTPDPAGWYQFSDDQEMPLADLNVILMRKDPPFNQDYIYSTYLLELAEKSGSYIVNRPQSLRDANEKLYTAWFPHCCTDMLVTKEANRIREFLNKNQDIILKPWTAWAAPPSSVFNKTILISASSLKRSRAITVNLSWHKNTSLKSKMEINVCS